MDYLLCSCGSFTIQNGLNIECSNCGKIVGKIKESDNIILSVSYNSNPDMISTVNSRGNFVKIAQRCAHDITCLLVDNKLCKKCNAKSRFLRDNSGNPIFVCSNCRNITD